jgi:hypothetical protein
VTDHGFIGFRAGSPITLKELHQIAEKISNVHSVRWVHVLKGWEKGVINIIVEFDPRACMRHAKGADCMAYLSREIEAIGGHEPKHIWKIQFSLRGPK